MKLGLSPLLAVALLAAPSLAHAQPETVPPAVIESAPPPVVDSPPPAAAPTVPRYDYLRLGAGFRIGHVDDPAYDAFAKRDVLAQMSLEATYAFYTKGKLAIASGVGWDVGGSSAGARGLTTRLTVHRLSVPIEARYYVGSWLNVFAKVAPGAGVLAVHVEDPSSQASLEHAPWVFSADFSGGASLRLAGGSDHRVRRARLWLTSEVGYGVTSGHALRPQPNRSADDVLGTDESTKLGSLALNGVFWRTGLAVTF